MSATDFNDLLRHVGHNIKVVTYGKDCPLNVAIECHTCNEVCEDCNKTARIPMKEYKELVYRIRGWKPIE